MTVHDLEHFRNLLVEREHLLHDLLREPEACCPGDIDKVKSLLNDIKAAVGRVENGSYGTCKVCKDGVELHRLEVQPVEEICLGCITTEERNKLEEELFLASKIHRALLPQSFEKIEGFEMSVRSIAARIIGGDYYDFLPMQNSDFVRIVVADTMGKGLPAGMLMSNVQGALRIFAETLESPKELIGRLNKWLCRNIPVTKFVSLTCAAIEQGSGEANQIIFTNAGHLPGLLIRKNGKIDWLESNSGVLGVHEGFQYEERNLAISSGDMLVLYTDGVTEAANSNDIMFGENRLAEFVLANRNQEIDSMLNNLQSEILSFSGRKEFEDDYTILAIRKL